MKLGQELKPATPKQIPRKGSPDRIAEQLLQHKRGQKSLASAVAGLNREAISREKVYPDKP